MSEPINQLEPTVIDDAAASRYMRDFDTAPEADRPMMRRAVEDYALRREQSERGDEGERLSKLFTDQDTFDQQAKRPAMKAAAASSLDPNAVPIKIANQAYLEFATGRKSGELADAYEPYRNAFGEKETGKPTITDQEMFSLVRDKFTGEKVRAMDQQLILGDVMNGLFEEITTGKPQSGAAYLQNYKASNPEFAKGLKPKEEANYLKGILATRDDLRERFTQYAPTAKRLYDEVTSQTGQKEGQGAGSVIGEIANMPKADQDILYSAVLLAAQRSGFEPKGFLMDLSKKLGIEALSTFTMQAGESLGRGTIGAMSQTARVTMEDSLRGELQAYNEGARLGTDDPAQRDKRAEEIKTQLQVIDVLRRVDSLAQEADPIKTVSKSWLGQVAEKSVYGVGSSAGIMASSMVPVIGPALTFAAYRAGNYERLRNEAPDLAPETASSYATAMAIPESILDRFQMDILFRKAPVFSETLKAMTLSKKGMVGAMANFGKTAGVMTTVETGTELVQNFIPLVVDQIGMALEEDYPQHNFREDLAQYRDAIPETVGTMLIMSMLGAGVATISDTRNGRHLLEVAQPMTDYGISDEGAAKIITAPTEEEKLSIFKEEAAKRTPESIAAGVAASNERAARQGQAEPNSATIEFKEIAGETDESGLPVIMRTVRDGRGNVVLETKDGDAADMAYTELRRDEMTGQTSGIAEGLEHIKAVNEAIGRGEDVQKILTGKGSQSFLEIYNTDKTPEHLDRLFETVRSHGYEIKEVEQLAGYFVKASNRGRLKDGIYKSIIAVSDGADGVHLMRDYSQDNLKRAIEEGDTTIEWVRDQLDSLKGHKEFANLLTETDTNVVEAFSDVAVSYFLGRTKESQIPSGLRTFMRQIAMILKEIIGRSYRLKKAIASGDVNQNFQQLLASSTGLDVDQISRMEGEKEARRMTQEALDSVNAGEGTPGVELLDVLTSSSEKLPDSKSPFFTSEIGRLKELVQQLGKGTMAGRKKMKLKDLFSNDAKDPDLLVGAFNEAGHAFFTVDDMVQALEERIRTDKAQVGTISADAEYGAANYSIGEDDYRGVHRAPTGKFEEGSIDAMNRTYPDDLYSKDGARYYGDGNIATDSQIHRLIVSLKGKPDSDVKIYRAVPKGATADINPGDWVTPSRAYAKMHGGRWEQGTDIIFKTVKARELFTEGNSLYEFGWSPEGSANYSISKGNEDRVQAALDAKLNRNPAARLELYKRAKVKFDEVRAKRGMSEDPNKKFSSLLQSMTELSAILSVLPKDIRGKVGGLMHLANMGKDTIQGNQVATVDKFIEKRIGMIDKELERVLRKEYLSKFKKTFERSLPSKDKKGVMNSKLGPEASSFIQDAYAASLLDKDTANERMQEIQGRLADEDSQAKIQELVGEWSALNTFGGLSEASADHLDGALSELTDAIKGGREKWKLEQDARRDEMKGLVKSGLKTLGEYSPEELNRKRNESRTFILSNMTDAYNRHLAPFQLFQHIFGKDHPIAKRFSDALRNSTMKKNLIMMRVKKDYDNAARLALGFKKDQRGVNVRWAIDESLVKLMQQKPGVEILVGRKVAKAKISIELAQKIADGEAMAVGVSKLDVDSIDEGEVIMTGEKLPALTPDHIEAIREELLAHKERMASRDFDSMGSDNARYAIGPKSISVDLVMNEGEAGPKTMNGLEAMQYLATWGQPDGRVHMERQGFSEKSVEQMNGLIDSPFGKAIYAEMMRQYKEGYELHNPVYRKFFGMDMPSGQNYSPFSFVALEKMDAPLMPGEKTGAGGIMPSHVKARVNHNATLEQSNMADMFWRHFEQASYWVSFAETVRDMRSVLLNKDLMNSIETVHGADTAKAVKDTVGYFADGGVPVKNRVYEAFFNRIVQSISAATLGFKLSSALNQNDNFFRFATRLTLKQQREGLQSLFSGEFVNKYKWALNSDTIQTRLEMGASPIVRMARDRNLISTKDNIIGKAARAAMLAVEGGYLPMQYTDAALTTFSGAVIYESAYNNALAEGMTEDQAMEFANDRMDRDIFETAQPADAANRSLHENMSSGWARAYMQFMSDQRLKFAMQGEAYRGIAKGQNVGDNIRTLAVLGLMGMMGELVRAMYRDWFTDDDDEEIWKTSNFARAFALGPVNGFFLYGTILDSLVRGLTGDKFYGSTGPLERFFKDIESLLKNGDKLVDFSDTEKSKRAWKSAARVAGSSNIGMTVPAMAINIIDPITGLVGNLKEEDDK